MSARSAWRLAAGAALAAAGLAALCGCAATPGANPAPAAMPPPASAADARLGAALELLRRTGSREHWYGIYENDVKVGYKQVTRRVAPGFVDIATRLVLRSRDESGVTELTQQIYERFETSAPGRATTLRVTTEGYGQVVAASIQRRGDVYVAQSDDVPSRVLADFRFTLADRFAPHVWLTGQPAVESCLAYPSYSLEDLERRWLTECLVKYGELAVDGAPVPVAVMLQIEGDATRAIVQRGLDGRELVETVGPKSYVRAEAKATARILPGEPADSRAR